MDNQKPWPSGLDLLVWFLHEKIDEEPSPDPPKIKSWLEEFYQKDLLEHRLLAASEELAAARARIAELEGLLLDLHKVRQAFMDWPSEDVIKPTVPPHEAMQKMADVLDALYREANAIVFARRVAESACHG